MVAIIVVVTTLTGCLSTLHPLFTKKDLVFDPRLVGRWKAGDDNDTVVFERGTPANFDQLPEALRKLSHKGYLVTVGDENNVAKYYAFLTSLGQQRYIDYYPCENAHQARYDDFYKQHLVKMHSFHRIRFNDDQSFETSQFDEEFLKQLIDKKQIRIKYEVRYDGKYVITAPTEELQQYVLKYGDVPAAYYKDGNAVYRKIP